MISQNSLWRKLPAVLDPKQRLQLEAIVFATDVVTYDFRRLVEIGTRHGRDTSTLGDERPALFTHAWSIVDQLYVLRQLLENLFPESKSVEEFCAKYEAAALLRNGMDHLPQKIGNLAGAKGMRPPVFGAVSYFVFDDAAVSIKNGKKLVSEGDVITVTAGAFTRGRQLYAFPNPVGRIFRASACLFRIFAFDNIVELEDAVVDLGNLLDRLQRFVDEDIRGQIEKFAKQAGVSGESLLAAPPGNFVLSLTMKFEATTEAAA